MLKITTKEHLNLETIGRYHITPAYEYIGTAVNINSKGYKRVQIKNNTGTIRWVPIKCFVEEEVLNALPHTIWTNFPKTKHH